MKTLANIGRFSPVRHPTAVSRGSGVLQRAERQAPPFVVPVVMRLSWLGRQQSACAVACVSTKNATGVSSSRVKGHCASRNRLLVGIVPIRKGLVLPKAIGTIFNRGTVAANA